MARRYKKSKRRSFFDYLATILFVCMVAFSAAWLERNNATEVLAPARVVDGDSLELDGQRVRLVGIDAPELNQICQGQQGDYSCGVKARDHLRTLIGNSTQIKCVGEGDDKYGRLLAECFVGETSLNSTMVRDGWAISYGGFGWIERTAQKEKLGLWAGNFDNPSDWRAKTGGLVENQSGVVLRRVWRRAKAWFASVGEE